MGRPAYDLLTELCEAHLSARGRPVAAHPADPEA
jgi:hypothetical protein